MGNSFIVLTARTKLSHNIEPNEKRLHADLKDIKSTQEG